MTDGDMHCMNLLNYPPVLKSDGTEKPNTEKFFLKAIALVDAKENVKV